MSLPTILRSADGAIDVPYEVISEKNTLLGTLRGAANKIWTPIDRFARRASGYDFYKSVKDYRGAIENEYALYKNRQEGLDDALAMVRDKIRTQTGAKARKLLELEQYMMNKKSLDNILGPSLEDAFTEKRFPDFIGPELEGAKNNVLRALDDWRKTSLPIAIGGAVAGIAAPLAINYSKYRRDKKKSGIEDKSQPGYLSMLYGAAKVENLIPKRHKEKVYKQHKPYIYGMGALSALSSLAVPVAVGSIIENKPSLSLLKSPLVALGALSSYGSGVSSAERALARKHLPAEVYERFGVTKHSPNYFTFNEEAKRNLL